MKVLFRQLSEPPKKMMILGSACSTVTEPMAQTSREFDLVQVKSTVRVLQIFKADFFNCFSILSPIAEIAL